MEGADKLRYPNRMDRHKTKVNAVTRGQPGQDATAFNEEMCLDLDDFFHMFNRTLPKQVNPMSVEELIALLYHDNKARFEFQCIAGHQKATHKGVAYWPFRIRAVQGHTKRAMDTAEASDAINAVEIFAISGAAAIQKMNAKGKKITTPNMCPGVIYHHTTEGNWKGILRDGFIAGGGERVSSGRAHSYFSEVQVDDKNYVSGLRAERPIEIRIAMSEAVRSGVIFFKTSSAGILTSDLIPPSLHSLSSRLTILKRNQPVSTSRGHCTFCSWQRWGERSPGVGEVLRGEIFSKPWIHISGRLNWRARCTCDFSRENEASATECRSDNRYARLWK